MAGEEGRHGRIKGSGEGRGQGQDGD